ncbi:hypothetical protein EVAR_28492_1 [Eumeta japonica]|uniref:Uncharacterized protein n=1 Tax=Eumeta variegata TaxID=151549 RepID=A0A4C1WQL8_EUMVA|nr:hypothetical protein EVAR_28492_1 [Eumeta japonica]
MGQISGPRNRRACMERSMDVREAREILKDAQISAYPFWEIGGSLGPRQDEPKEAHYFTFLEAFRRMCKPSYHRPE